MTASVHASRPRLPAPALVGLALLMAAAAYARILHGELQFDDGHVIEQNLSIKSLPAAVGAALHEPISRRPLVTLSFALNYAAGRLDTWGYHLVNVAIHLAAVVLLYRLGLLLFNRARAARPELLAAAAAGVFALHPLASQAVSYLSQRGESLASLLAVAHLLLLFAAEDAPTRLRASVLALLAAAALALALLAKVTLIAAPLLWVAAVAAFPRDPAEPLRPRLLRMARLAAPALLVVALVARASVAQLHGKGDGGFDIPGLGPVDYLLSQPRAVLLYARLFFWPAGQSVEHEVPTVRSLDPSTAAAGLLLLAWFAAGIWVLFRPPRVAERARSAIRLAGLGSTWWFLSLAPTSTIVPVLDLAVEHRAYLASFGLALAVVALADLALGLLSEPMRARAAIASLAAVWVALAVTLHGRNAVWESKAALWDDAASKAPRNVRARINSAFARHDKGDLEGAVAGYRMALALDAPNGKDRTFILHLLGAALSQLERPAEAYEVFRSGLAAEPWNLDLLNGAAITALDLGRPEEAERLAESAIVANPAFGKGLNTLGEAQLAQGRFDAALASFERAAALDPDVAQRHFNVALAAARAGRSARGCAALADYRAAARSAQLDARAAELGATLSCPAPGGRAP